MIAGRWDNFYWGAMIAPTLFVGLVFAPRAAAAGPEGAHEASAKLIAPHRTLLQKPQL
ncbi:hypothetical protein [Novosphingobium panipatense]|uniref:hypothetical protein n=1 Tax=Novosphingobium panipatense TaxID=428991 RepID=UPI0036081242